jgi:methylated-DNA-[protein]-cysteine S-methyltransferase
LAIASAKRQVHILLSASGLLALSGGRGILLLIMRNGPNLEASIRAGKIEPGMSFNQRVWALTARIPKGRVTTYGELARALGTKAYRAVGNAMNKNPYAPGVPCHRVVGSNLTLTGFAGGLEKKRAMLRGEGVDCTEKGVVVEKFVTAEELMGLG